MFDILKGTVTLIGEKTVTLMIGGIGFAIHVPRSERLNLETEVTLHTYLHWNQENGPALFGFLSTQERTVFQLIIDCPKIGPTLGLNVLSQLSIGQFIDAISTHNVKILSSVSGIGEKKAEQIIVELKNKVQKLVLSGHLQKEEQQSFSAWHQVSEVLLSLNYTRQEIAGAMTHLSEKCGSQNYPLDHLIRNALTFLSQAKV